MPLRSGRIRWIVGCLLVAIAVAALGWNFRRTPSIPRLKAALAAHGLRGRAMGDPLLPHWIDRRLPSFLLPYVRTLCGVDIDAFHGPPEALAFLADFPEIEYCAFRGGRIDRNVVRALRVLPQLRNLNFTTAYHFQAAECLPEIAQLKSLQQVSILGAPPISGLLLREFTVGRPDVAVSLGNGPVIND